MRTDLYRHFDKDENLLYVGVSLNSIMRLMQHSIDSHWFQEIRTITIEKFQNRFLAMDAETVAIILERPMHNVMKYDGAFDPRKFHNHPLDEYRVRGLMEIPEFIERNDMNKKLFYRMLKVGLAPDIMYISAHCKRISLTAEEEWRHMIICAREQATASERPLEA